MDNGNINNYQDLYNTVGQIYQQKSDNFKNILEELRETFNFLQDGTLDESELNRIWEIPNEEVIPPETEYYDCLSAISVEKPEMKKSSQISFKTENSNTTYYLEAISKSPCVPKTTKSINKPYSPINEESTGRSFLKDSICTTDMNYPLGTSTPTSPDVEIQTPAQSAQVSSTRTEWNKQPNRIKPKIKPNSSALRDKSVNVNFSATKLDVAQKNKTVRLNATVAANKRKREERTQKVITQKEALDRVKRPPVLKVEKEQEARRKLAQKKKDEKSTLKVTINVPKKEQNSVQKNKNVTNEPSKIKKEIVEYDITHIIEDGSSDEEDDPKNFLPKWATKEMREYPIQVQSWLNKEETVIPWFFSDRLKQPSLEELFSTTMTLRPRPRTSSAVWHK